MTIKLPENSTQLKAKSLKLQKGRGKLRHASPEELTQRDILIWNLRSQQRMTQEQIAQQVGVSVATVCQTLKAVSERATKNLAEAAQVELAMQIEALGRIVVELWGAWERSKQVEKVVSRKQFETGGDEDTKTHTTTRIRERVGDTRILEQLRLTLADLRELYNLKKSVNVSFTWQTEITQMLMLNQISIDDVKEELGPELAGEFIEMLGE